MTGGQWVAHPGNDGVEYSVRITDRSHFISQDIGDYTVRSEQYYMHTDPSNHVLAVTRFPTPGADGRTSRTAPSICRGMDPHVRRWAGLLPSVATTPPRSLNLKPCASSPAASSGPHTRNANSAGLGQSGVGRCLRPRQGSKSYKPWPIQSRIGQAGSGAKGRRGRRHRPTELSRR